MTPANREGTDMDRLNPLNDPTIAYLDTLLRNRYYRARAAESRGASAIEWAIITGILAAIAIMVGGLIYKKVHDSANKINTNSNVGK